MEFPAFYGTQKLIAVYTTAHHFSPNSVHQPLFPFLNTGLHLRLGLVSGLLHSGSPTKTRYAFLFSSLRAT